MKKHLFSFILAFVIVLVISLSVSLAENIDFASMSFEDLSALKNAVDQEYFSRPGSEGLMLASGQYLVGRDIQPGVYWAAMTEPHSSYNQSGILVFEDEAAFATGRIASAKIIESLTLGQIPKNFILKEGNVLKVDGAPAKFKLSQITEDECYKYQPPEGTLVPNGTYTVGVDIPVGSYRIYPATIFGGKFEAYGYETKEDGSVSKTYRTTREGRITVGVYAIDDSKTVSLKENDILDVTESIIMKKAPALTFD